MQDHPEKRESIGYYIGEEWHEPDASHEKVRDVVAVFMLVGAAVVLAVMLFKLIW